LRSRVAWCGAADLLPYLAHVIRSGGIDVVLTFGAPLVYDRAATASGSPACSRPRYAG
jgi:hypothetical protein